MKRFLLFALIAVLTSCGTSKSVGYTYKPLAKEGCSVSFSALNQEGQLLIIVSIKSDRLVFSENPIMMLKNFKGEVLKLEGADIDSRSETGGVLIGSIVLPITEVNALAQFPIEKDDIAFFESGVSKNRLSTLPIVHEREFPSDVIGSYLLSELRKASISEDTF